MRSEVMIYDMVTGRVRSVLQSDDLIEAPNWSRDGSFLIVNRDGKLCRILLQSPTLIEIPIAGATRNNNDHGLSPDGTRLAISDHTETGASCIYTVPVEGGSPRKVTNHQPSYWHGWSPDGQTFAFCGERSGKFDIYTIPATGGDEQRLTDGIGHSDGPDYTPDGKWIWFNSSRSGAMQLWRMHTDGSNLQQMTDDRFSNWFPHPSPDGKMLLYLAYAEGVDGHPRDHDVELKLMAADGGVARSVVKLFGGQGSINVPNWAPDSSAFAFVQYRPAA